MAKTEADFNFICNSCMVAVRERTHERHMKILDAITFAEVPGNEDLFVHVRGSIREFDADGFVVVCDKCFVDELSENLREESDE
jgi:hypothetical protein